MRIDIRDAASTSRRARVGPMALALAAIALALWAQSQASRGNLLDAGIVFAVAIFAIVWSALGKIDPFTRAYSPAPNLLTHGKRHRWAWPALATGCIASIVSLAFFRQTPEAALPWALFAASLPLGLLGLILLSPAVPRVPRMVTRPEILLVSLIVLIAAFFRLYHLAEQPAGLFYDEAMYGLDAQRVVSGAAYPVYFEANYGRGALYIYLLAGLVKFAGADAFTLRLASAFIGILTVPALYVFARSITSKQVALIAAFLLAVSRWHVNFSRVAFDAIALPAIELVFLYFLVKAVRGGRSSDFVWAGLAAGIGLNSYVAFRLVPLIGACYLAMAITRRETGAGRLARGLVLTVFATVLVAAPFLQLYLLHPEVVNQRLAVANVFAGQTFADGLNAILESTRKHLLMFNVAGDANGRHNLPGEPMLDFFSAALFVVGLGYAAARVKRTKPALLLVWLAAMLSAGIFSVGFEAPQALRTIGAIPAIMLLCAVPLSLLLAKATEIGHFARPLGLVIVIGLLLGSGVLNYQNYFLRQASSFASWNDFSTGEAFTAREMKRLGPDWQFYVTAARYEHPTVRFLAPEMKNYHRVEATDYLPLHQNGDRNVAIFLDIQQAGLYAQAKRYYPNATFHEFVPPFGGPPSMLEVLLRTDDFRAIQGLDAAYYANLDWSGEPAVRRPEANIDLDRSPFADLKPPYSVEWDGSLYVDKFESRTIGVESPDPVEVWIDGKLTLSDQREQLLRLAKGNHSLRVRAQVASADGRTRLYWRSGDDKVAIAPADLYRSPVSSYGLLGSYYSNPNWAGQPVLQQIDPAIEMYFHVTPLPRPYSVEWQGMVQAPTAGVYGFGLESIDDSWLEIDGHPVVAAHQPNKYEEARVTLAAGWHQLQLRFVDKSGWSHVNLYWTPPGQGRQIVPAERLIPAGAPPQAPPPLPSPPIAPQGQNTPSGNTYTVPRSAMLLGVGQLKEPKDVLVLADGSVLVADSGNGRVARFGPDGSILGQIGQAGNNPGQIQHPVGLALASNGDLLVLDEAPGFVNRFTLRGDFLQRFAGPGTFFHPRSLAAGRDGKIYVADTGFARIVVFGADGIKQAEFGGRGSNPGELLGPTSVAVDVEGMLWVVDAENSRIQRLGPDGQYLGSFAIPPGESVDGAHLAITRNAVLVTDPLANRIRTYSFSGQLLSEFGAPGAGQGELRRPVGIAADAQGGIWVAERDNNRVQKFR